METKNKNPVAVFLASSIVLLVYFAQFCHGADILRHGEMIRDLNGEKLTSGGEIFELGFFSPENSTSRFVGIWYKVDVKAVVWVANGEHPISDRGGVLRIGDDGNLVVLDGNNKLVWSSNVSGLSNNTAAMLRNEGNFVLSNNKSIGDASRFLWQSFDNPTDTFLPGMQVPVIPAIEEYRAFSAWKSASDPSPGNYIAGVDPNAGPQIVIWDHTGRLWRSGQWNSQIFTGVPNMSSIASYLYGLKLSPPDGNGTQYFSYNPSNSSDLLRFRIGWDGMGQKLRWDDGEKKWKVLLIEPDPANKCELYNHCGNYAICENSNSLSCSCLEGYKPKFPDQWSRGNWSGGCERKIELQCPRNTGENSKSDGFKRLRCAKLPDLAYLLSTTGNLDTCKTSCSGNCSCIAYAFITSIGCMIWTRDLVDIQHFDQSRSLQFFYRVHHSELDGGRKISNIAIIIISLVGVCILMSSFWLLWMYKKKLIGLPVVSSMPCLRTMM